EFAQFAKNRTRNHLQQRLTLGRLTTDQGLRLLRQKTIKRRRDNIGNNAEAVAVNQHHKQRQQHTQYPGEKIQPVRQPFHEQLQNIAELLNQRGGYNDENQCIDQHWNQDEQAQFWVKQQFQTFEQIASAVEEVAFVHFESTWRVGASS